MNADLNELLERVKAATGPDRELDAAIERVVGAAPRKLGSGPAMRPSCPPFTFSVDSALALVERLLPDHGPNMVYSYDLNWHASAHAHMSYAAELFVAEGDPCEMVSYHGQAHTLPLAILAALLSALISKESQS